MKKCIIFDSEQIHSIPIFELEIVPMPFIVKGFSVCINLKNSILNTLAKASNFKNELKSHLLGGILYYNN